MIYFPNIQNCTRRDPGTQQISQEIILELNQPNKQRLHSKDGHCCAEHERKTESSSSHFTSTGGTDLECRSVLGTQCGASRHGHAEDAVGTRSAPIPVLGGDCLPAAQDPYFLDGKPGLRGSPASPQSRPARFSAVTRCNQGSDPKVPHLWMWTGVHRTPSGKQPFTRGEAQTHPTCANLHTFLHITGWELGGVGAGFFLKLSGFSELFFAITMD